VLTFKSDLFSVLMILVFLVLKDEEFQRLMNIIEFLILVGFQRFEFFGKLFCDKAN
jgi:hypothetical protein